jgi:p-aminobenzoyl-glutamate transporter AbgT
MGIWGLGSDVILLILLLVGWFVLMRFVLPRLGIST